MSALMIHPVRLGSRMEMRLLSQNSVVEDDSGRHLLVTWDVQVAGNLDLVVRDGENKISNPIYSLPSINLSKDGKLVLSGVKPVSNRVYVRGDIILGRVFNHYNSRMEEAGI